jgi:chromosome segregation ATPase
MTPAEREEALERREANAALLTAKLEKDRAALEAEINASAAAARAASAINRALQSDAAKKVKALEDEAAQWEAKIARLKSEVGKLELASGAASRKSDEELARETAAIAAARTQLDGDRAAFDKEVAETRARLKSEAQALAELRAKLVTIRNEIEGNVKLREAEVRKKEALIESERVRLQEAADAIARAESDQSEQRAKLEAQLAALAAKEVMFEERSRQLQERLKNFAKA